MLIDLPKIISKRLSDRIRDRTLLIRRVDLLPGRRKKRPLAIAIHRGGLPARRIVKSKKSGIPQHIRHAAVKKNRRGRSLHPVIVAHHSRQHQVHKEARVFFGHAVSVNSSLLGKDRTRRLLDPQKTQAAQMLEQRRLAASKRSGKENKAVCNHDSDKSYDSRRDRVAVNVNCAFVLAQSYEFEWRSKASVAHSTNDTSMTMPPLT